MFSTRANRFRQSGLVHTNGFSPVCTRKWLTSLYWAPKPFIYRGQPLQLQLFAEPESLKMKISWLRKSWDLLVKMCPAMFHKLRSPFKISSTYGTLNRGITTVRKSTQFPLTSKATSFIIVFGLIHIIRTVDGFGKIIFVCVNHWNKNQVSANLDRPSLEHKSYLQKNRFLHQILQFWQGHSQRTIYYPRRRIPYRTRMGRLRMWSVLLEKNSSCSLLFPKHVFANAK